MSLPPTWLLITDWSISTMLSHIVFWRFFFVFIIILFSVYLFFACYEQQQQKIAKKRYNKVKKHLKIRVGRRLDIGPDRSIFILAPRTEENVRYFFFVFHVIWFQNWRRRWINSMEKRTHPQFVRDVDDVSRHF